MASTGRPGRLYFLEAMAIRSDNVACQIANTVIPEGQATKYRNRVLGLLCLLMVITYLDRVCISVAGPRMQRLST